MNWIKSSESLPELDKKVLIFFEDDFHIAIRTEMYDRKNDEYEWYISNWYKKPKVEYWTYVQGPEIHIKCKHYIRS
jgi:hypothetical protein